MCRKLLLRKLNETLLISNVCDFIFSFEVGLEKMATEHTRLLYMTTGVLLEKLVAAKTLTEYSHIFIDEVHKRSVSKLKCE